FGNSQALFSISSTSGVTYYDSLFADVTEGFPSAVYARATAGGQPPDFLTEEFLNFEYPGYTLNPFDLNFSQIFYSPTGPPSTSLGVTSPLGDYDNYTVTVRRSVYEFPVPRGDADNGSWEINLREDGGLWVGNTVEGIAMKHPFPFFQQTYSQVYLGANGYLAFEQVSDSDNRNYPLYSSHFAIPRISFLFANLAPKIGGEIWAKSLDDRFVVTFEDMPQWDPYIYPPSSSPNSVQVELFYSGHVRITYGAVNAYYAIVGLSDGRGVPINPALLFENLRSVSSMTDFSTILSTPTALSIDPITPPEVEAGDVAEFTAYATAPISLGYPSLLAQWTLEDFPSFYDEGNGTGHFRWETNIEDDGEHIVRVSAFLADQTAYQDVRVWVNIGKPLPAAVDLGIRTNNAVEDPTRSQTVSDETELIAMYTYTHPLQYILPEYYQEGYTQILWFRNQQSVPALANLPVVPPFYTQPNDQWCFKVLPVTLSGQQGMFATSPVVTILSLPKILDVVRVLDLPPGEIYPEQLPFPNVAMAWDFSSGGAEIAILGRKLSHATSIKIGGIQCTSVESINDNRIDVIAPAHLPSPVVGGQPLAETIVVTTTAGTNFMTNAVVYVASGAEISKADVNMDGVVDAVDVQLVINTVLMATKNEIDADVNRDGKVNSVDIQAVINEALHVK
ncbi:MAG: dockerin type I domain-containing protein, partial [Candidatus Hydrogenedentes bacterium]|nr:dockerin type I domain-containing protein [Candidatus Hydrogenedentota bacterium]